MLESDKRAETLARFTPEQRFVVIALVEQGRSAAWVTRKLRCSRSTVYRRLRAAQRRRGHGSRLP